MTAQFNRLITHRVYSTNYRQMREPIADVNILTPQDYVGGIMSLCVERRGVQKNMHFSQDKCPCIGKCP